MSLICETIVSEDELSHERPEEDELDFEEEEIHDEDKDEGELDDDEDLEEGEVKEDDEEPPLQPPPQTTRQNSICRFYGRGQCTWGNNCRFVHPTGGIVKRPPPPPPPLPPMNRRAREWTEPNNESAWERGLKQAKEMIVRASRRKEEEVDFEDKRFNLSTDDKREQSPDRFNDEEYERRRRLAFESAPWNNEEPPGARMRVAETYRDPWRRSKSPAQTQKARRAPTSKRSHSMSSISASGSDSSDFSGSEGSESFSESSSARSGRVNRKTVSEKKKEEYDSWSESLSESDSSYYSESAEDKPQKKKQKTTQEEPKKSPIKMTFMKKNAKKENFNPLLQEEESKEEEEEPRGLQATFSRREELLQQLKAVEDAIARKRSKIN